MTRITVARAMRIAGIPKASEKQVSSPKHWTSCLRIGVRAVEMREPALMEK